MNDRAGPSTPIEHAHHDELLVARLAAGDLETAEAAAAERQLAACAACRELQADLRAIARSLAADLPRPRRRRDFRLSADEAQRLRGSTIRRLLAPLAAPDLRFLQPLAAAAVAIGLALVVVDALPFAPPEAPAPAAATMAAAPEETPGAPAEEAPLGGAGGPDESPPAAGRQTDMSRELPGVEAAGDSAATAGAPDWGLIGLLILIGGLAVLAARWLAIRQMRDPRLR